MEVLFSEEFFVGLDQFDRGFLAAFESFQLCLNFLVLPEEGFIFSHQLHVVVEVLQGLLFPVEVVVLPILHVVLAGGALYLFFADFGDVVEDMGFL